ncbi:MAG: hypothetical protein Q4G64_01165 [bacterium]|nr:hypothetical protein [bacterium]
MALITLASAKGAPGVTTAALGLAMNWGSPVLLVEADVSGSSILAGYKKGEIPHDRGIVPLAVAQMQMSLIDAIWTQTIELKKDVLLLAGFANPAQSGAIGSLWGDLGSAFRSLEAASVDVIVDLGRVGARVDEREALITLADHHLLLTRSSLASVYTTREFAQRYSKVAEVAADILGTATVVVGPGRPYGAREIAKTCGLPLAGDIAWDPKSAVVYSQGVAEPRNFASRPLNRSLGALGSAVRERIVRRRQQLQGAT